MRWPKYFFAAAGLLAAVLLILPLVPLFEQSRFACSRCRAIKHNERWLGVPIVRLERTDYTRWFEARSPQHEHRWRWSGSRSTRYFRGEAVACGKRHPVWELDPFLQRGFIESASPEQTTRFYTLIESSERFEQQEAVALVLAYHLSRHVP